MKQDVKVFTFYSSEVIAVVYVVGYCQNKSGKDYTGLYNAISSYPHMRFINSMWLISTSDSIQVVYDKLKLYIDEKDYLLIIQAKDNYIGWLPKSEHNWMNKAKF